LRSDPINSAGPVGNAEQEARMIERLFFSHPAAIGESYREHAAVAARFGLSMMAGGLACIVHAAIPALFEHSASDRVNRLHAQMGERRRLAHQPGDPGAGSWAPNYEI
jgi:hypothetical protein